MVQCVRRSLRRMKGSHCARFRDVFCGYAVGPIMAAKSL